MRLAGNKRFAELVDKSSDIEELAHAIAIKVAEHAKELVIDNKTSCFQATKECGGYRNISI